MIDQFNDLINASDWKDLECFINFKLCLQDSALADWRLVEPQTIVEQKKEGSFLIIQTKWLSEYIFAPEAFVWQKQWMQRDLKKPYEMKVNEFKKRLITMSQLLDKIPHSSSSTSLSTDDLKVIFLSSYASYLADGLRSTSRRFR